MRRSEIVGAVVLLAAMGCSEPCDPYAQLDVSEIKCNTHRAAAGLPACMYALERFLAKREFRIVNVIAAEDGTNETERLFVIHTRSDPRWPAASDMIVAPLDGPINDKRLIVVTLRSGKGQRLYVVQPYTSGGRAKD
jgi:hypothetical protein